VCEIKGLRVKFYFSHDVARGEKIWNSKKEGGINIFFRQIYRPLLSGVYIFDFTSPPRGDGEIWPKRHLGKNMKRRRKEDKKKIGEKLNKQYYFISLNWVRFTNLRTGTRKKSLRLHSIKSPQLFSITLMSDCLCLFPIYLREGKKLSEWSLKFTFPWCQVWKKFYSAKKVSQQFFLYCADISL
jgi:hypothetical protein